MLRHYAFVSSTRTSKDGTGFRQIFESALRNNRRDGLTGLLFYSEGLFFSYTEGEAETLRTRIRTMRADPRHGRLIDLLDAPVERPILAEWRMGEDRAASGDCVGARISLQEIAAGYRTGAPAFEPPLSDLVGAWLRTVGLLRV